MTSPKHFATRPHTVAVRTTDGRTMSLGTFANYWLAEPVREAALTSALVVSATLLISLGAPV